ncbi:MAG TPA: acyltransferase family protein [Fibrobacteria bacterium]|nr:acyltransferase family protein [Fibrobacteria bacterium]
MIQVTEAPKFKNSPREEFLDAAKGFGIICVLFYHSREIPHGHYISSFFMQLFFLVSGYSYKFGRGLWNDISKKWRGLILPYIYYNIFLLIVRIFFDIISSKFSPSLYFEIIQGALYSRYCLYPMGFEPNHYFLTNHNSPMWFLTALMTSTVLFLLILKAIQRRPSFLWVAIAILIICTAVTSQLPILLPWSVDTAPVGAVFLFFGVVIAQRKLLDLPRSWKSFAVLVSLGLLYILICHYNPNISMFSRTYGTHGMFSVINFVLLGALGSYLCIYSIKQIAHTKISKLLALFGKITIPILCLHLLIFNLLDRLTTTLLGIEADSLRTYWLYIIIRIAITLCLCIGIANFFSLAASMVRKRTADSAAQ